MRCTTGAEVLITRLSHYEVYMKESKEDKTVQLMESAVIALENIASILTQIAQIACHQGADQNKAVLPVSDKISYPAKEEQETVLQLLTLEDLRQACIQASQHNIEAKNTIRSILTGKYGVKNISGLDTKDYYAFWKEIQSL